jgi:hypothetical protein
LGRDVDERFSRRYDWDEIQRFYDLGHTPTECCVRFGCSKASWNSARLRGDLRVRPTATPLEEWLVAGRSRTRYHLKNRLLAAGLKDGRCERCGIAEWRGEALSLALHHVNGDGSDNRLENLELLCPNCHSQTDNFAGRARRVSPSCGRSARTGR